MLYEEVLSISKQLEEAGFFRGLNSNSACYNKGAMHVEFKPYYGHMWTADISYEIEYYTRVKFVEIKEVFTPEWVWEEYEKLYALFKFFRS